MRAYGACAFAGETVVLGEFLCLEKEEKEEITVVLADKSALRQPRKEELLLKVLFSSVV